MGVCDSENKDQNYSKIPTIQHVQTIGDPNIHGYKFNFPEKKDLSQKKFNLKFIFYNFKVKYCVSHKPSKDSIYITEIIIGQKKFPIMTNQGQSPNIPNPDDIQNGFFEEKEYTIEELENSYLLINIYEILDDISDSLEELGNGIPESYKEKCKFNSFFRINLLSFLFNAMKCDFPMMGTNQLSNKTRISFFCFIEHKEKIAIKAKPIYSNLDYKNFVFRLNNKIINCPKKQSDNSFVIVTPPISILELQRGDLYLETIENSDYYQYLSLNSLKADIINNLGLQILKTKDNFNIDIHQPVNINDPSYNQNLNNNPNNLINKNGYAQKNQNQYNQIFNQTQFKGNKKANLYFQNLPIICQLSNLYFTEYGNIYSTGILNLINNDPEVQNYRKNKNISSDNFYEKLYGYSTELAKANYDFSILNEIHVLLMRSIDNDRFMFIYPSLDKLNQMVILFMMVGLKIIEIIRKTTEDYKIIILIKLINILMKRVELENEVLYECMTRYKGTPHDPQKLYNQLLVELFYLYELLLSDRLAPNNDGVLIELFSRLYFQKSIIRKAILYSLLRDNKIMNNNILVPNDIFIYDLYNDEKLNQYVKKDTKRVFQKFIDNKKYFENITFDKYRLIKRIISFLNDININQYPFDFILFDNNIVILDIIERDINLLKYEKIVLNNDFYESLMLLSNSFVSISNVSNALIKATNGHNQTAVYTLLIYYKSIFDYYISASNCKLIMDYNVFEKACKLLVENEDAISLPRLFWLYYCCSDAILTPNLKWFIVNLVNTNFDKFAYHWSFTIRQVFFKLVIFIINDKLKLEEGKLFKSEKLIPFMNQNTNIINTNNQANIYTKEAFKDFNAIQNEYNDWMERKKEGGIEDYPLFNLPPPISNNGGID